MRLPATVVGLLIYCKLFAQADTTQYIVPNRINSKEQQQKPYVILIAADGFRYDYAEKFNAKNLLSLKQQGASSESMIPSYPSLTFPNHYAIVTGMYPSHNGLVNNYYYDRNLNAGYGLNNRATVEDGKRYGGTPLWVLAEKQQMVTAAFYWPVSEADVQGTRPTYYYKISDSISIDRRIEIIKNWLLLPDSIRPHFIAAYFPETDYAGHNYGPDSKQTDTTVQILDDMLGKLTEAVKTTGVPVNFIFVSDHGMTKMDYEHAIPIPAIIDTAEFIVPRGVELLMLYAKDKSFLQPTNQKLKAAAEDYDVLLPEEMPDYLHFSKADDRYNRIGDILLIPHWPRSFDPKSSTPKRGAHGFDPYKVKDMHAFFLAWGPAFKKVEIPSFQNIEVFPVITEILGLTNPGDIDATTKVADQILK